MPSWTPTLISNLPAHAQPALLNLRDLMLGQLPLWWLLVSVVITLLFLIFLYRTFTRTTDARLAALRYRFPTGVVIITIWASFGIYAISAANLLMIALFAVTGLLGYGLATRGGHPFTTEAPIYIASRLPANNIFFPPQVCIQPTLITYYRPRLIGRNEQSISITQMASINIQTRLLWADVIIETTGGAEPIVCHGHTKADAIAIKAQIEHYQRQYFTPAGAPLPRDRDNIPFPPSADAAPVSPNGPTLMLSLYHRDPAGADALQRWEQPIKRVRISADTPPDTRDATLLALLEEGGPGSHVNVQTLTTPSRRSNMPRSRSTLFLALTLLLIGCAATPPTLTPRAAHAPAQEAPSPITTTMATAPHTPITQTFPRVITPTPPPILAPVPAQAHHPTAPREERVLAQHALSDRLAVSPLRTSLDTAAPPLDDIFFDFDSFTLRPDAVATIKKNLRWLEAHPTTTVVLEGHCDERGSREYNLALGQQRADATVDYLVKAGLSPRRLWTLSYGKEVPFALDHNEAAWTLNRRAHFRYSDTPSTQHSPINP